MRRSAWEAAGAALDDTLAPWHLVDLCLRVQAAGLRNLVDPEVVVGLDGRAPWPRRDAGARASLARLRQRWRAAFEDDPAYNPNLSLQRTDYAWAFPPRVPRPWDALGVTATRWRR